jgi:hypothetical protein
MKKTINYVFFASVLVLHLSVVSHAAAQIDHTRKPATDGRTGLTIGTTLDFGNVLDPNYSFFTTGTPGVDENGIPLYKPSHMLWKLPEITFKRQFDRWLVWSNVVMGISDDGAYGSSSAAGYQMLAYKVEEMGFKVSYQATETFTPSLHIGTATGRRHYILGYGVQDIAVQPGAYWNIGPLTLGFDLPILANKIPGIEVWFYPNAQFELPDIGLAGSLAFDMILFNGGRGGTLDSGWTSIGTSYKTIGGVFQDMTVTLDYTIGKFNMNVTLSFPLQKNALGWDMDPDNPARGKGEGIFIIPELNYTVANGLTVTAGAYIYRIGLNPDYDWGADAWGVSQGKLALRPYIGASYTF